MLFRSCISDYGKEYKTRPEYKQYVVSRRGINRKNARCKRYKLTDERYNEMLAEQKGCCAVCDTPFSEDVEGILSCVDHDHDCCQGKRTCGKCTRGLLCATCNLALGVLKNITLLKAAISYLEKFQK